jgi:hypothetical protein
MLINPHQDSDFPDSAVETTKGEKYSAGPRYLHPERKPHLGVCDPEGSACFIFCSWIASTNFCKVNWLFSMLFQDEGLALGSGLAQGWHLMIGEPHQKWTAKNFTNWIIADRWSLRQQDGSQGQHVCPLRTDGNHMVWRCSYQKKKIFRPEAISRCIACCISLGCISE